MSKEFNNKDRHEEMQLASWVDQKFKMAMVNKNEYTKKWQTYEDAYRGIYFENKSKPDYKSDAVSNYIFSIVETIRPIMLDNNPKFLVLPRTPQGADKATKVDKALNYIWDREEMKPKLTKALINTLVTGTSVFFVPWDSKDSKASIVPVNPYNIFPDPYATDVDDAEYIIYATYKHASQLKKMFPDKAEHIEGGSVNYSELTGGNENETGTSNMVLTLECWIHDWTTIDVEENGTKKKKRKYPNGRVITVLPELGIVLDDKENPYKDGKFPFILFKNYDIPFKFWGEGDVEQLLSPQKYMNDLMNQIIDNAKSTANMPWILDKNSGIGYGKLNNRPGLIVRKTPGTEVKREQPPSMPVYVQNMVNEFKGDMEQISGVHDTLRGNSESGVYTAQGILALQEAGQARVRLKVDLMEHSISRLANMIYNRMRQFWKDEEYIRIMGKDGSIDFEEVNKEDFEYPYDIKVSSGSTMSVNKGAMLDLMIRMAQTTMEDGLPMVDREAIIQYLPVHDKQEILKRMDERSEKMEMQNEQVQELMATDEQLMAKDEEIGSILQELMSAVQEINKEIGTVQQKNAKEEEEEKLDKVREMSYNEGYKEAENMYGNESTPMQDETMQSETLPDDVLEQIEGLDDEQLGLLLQQQPELAEIIRKEQELDQEVQNMMGTPGMDSQGGM